MSDERLPTVLVIDDDAAIRELLGDFLGLRYEVVAASGGEEALEHLRARRFAAVVSDQNMPGMSGVAVLQRALELDPLAARVLVTSAADADAAIDAINVARATRYINKPFRAHEVLDSVGGAIREHTLQHENQHLVQELGAKNALLERALGELQVHERKLEREVAERTAELRTAVAQLEELALRDGLTGLYNHRFFQESLASELARAGRHSRKCALIFLDVDHFKHYNDLHGHVAGDDLLKSLARIISCTGDDPEIRIRGRLADIPARYGGEEFVIILPESDKAGAVVRAERVREEIARFPFPGREKQPGGAITVSVGVAGYPEDALTKRDLIESADRAVFEAKRGGRNRVVPGAKLVPAGDVADSLAD